MLLGLFSESRAQDPFYTQIFANRLQLNPALAGTQRQAVFVSQFRAQWTNIPGFYKQFGLAYDQPFKKMSQGFSWGINYQLDRAGEILTRQGVDLHFAKEWKFYNKHFLRFGAAAGVFQQTIDYSLLRFPNQIDQNGNIIPGTAPTGRERYYRPDLHIGVAYFNELLYLMGSVKHLQAGWFSDPQPSFYQAFIPRLYSLTSGLRLPLIPNALDGLGPVYISPAIHYQHQGEFDLYMIGLSLETRYFQLNSWWQPGSRLSWGIGGQLGPVRLAYNYDYYYADSKPGIFGPTHELSLSFRFGRILQDRGAIFPLPVY